MAVIPIATSLVMSEVAEERARQDVKWGQQNHPLVDRQLVGDVTRMAAAYQVPTSARARWMCQEAARRGEVTWTHILVEELAEFIEDASLHAAGDARASVASIRRELVQVAAVAVATVEAIDRRGGTS
jgi:hypothetical protein